MTRRPGRPRHLRPMPRPDTTVDRSAVYHRGRRVSLAIAVSGLVLFAASVAVILFEAAGVLP